MLKLKLQYLGHLMQKTDSLEKTLILGKMEGKRRRGWRIKWLDSIWLNGHESEQILGDSEGQRSLECCSPGLSDWTTTKYIDWLTDPIIFLIEVWLIYNIVLVSGVQHSDLKVVFFFLQIIFCYRLLQDIEHNSLCYMVNSCLSTLYM